MKKLVIFDFDGTLADTSGGILGSIKYVQQQMGLPDISYEQKLSHIGPPMEESYARNFGLSGEMLQKAINLHTEYARKQGFREVELYKGIPDLLQALKEKDIRVAIATLKNQTTVEKIINYFKIDDFFDFVKGTLPGENPSKSSLVRSCIKKNNLKERECLLVGDSIYDANGAKDLGVDFIAVTYGFGFKTKEELLRITCRCSCNTVQELQNAILAM